MHERLSYHKKQTNKQTNKNKKQKKLNSTICAFATVTPFENVMGHNDGSFNTSRHIFK